MKNKFILLITACLTVMALAACGSSSQTAQTTTAASQGGSEQTQTQAAQTGDEYSFTYKGVTVALNQDGQAATDSLKDYQKGEPTVTASCAFEGEDYQYYYGSFYMNTGTLNGQEIVDYIGIVDDTVATVEGLSIGDSKDKVEQLYGSEGYNGINAYIMNKGHGELTIIIKDDSVDSIQYTFKN